MTFRSSRLQLRRARCRAATIAALLAGSGAGFASAQPVDPGATPVGVWETFDPDTHAPNALVRIDAQADGTLSGTIVSGLGSNVLPGRRCSACTDARKDAPLQGMVFITGMKRSGPVDWSGGEVLDPDRGKTYHCTMHIEAGGRKLLVRGYLGVPLLGRSQTWVRQP